MAKTWFEQMKDEFPIKMPDEFFVQRIREMGHEPDDIYEDPNVYEPFTCSICGKKITDEFSNNAQPVNNGRCCNKCNREVVVPARIKGLK